MRQLIFRAWDRFENRMSDHFGLSLSYAPFSTPVIDAVPFQFLIGRPDRFEVMQFSGLRDANGVEIFEDDIVYLAGFGNYLVEFPFTELYEAAAESDIGTILGNMHQYEIGEIRDYGSTSVESPHGK